MKEGKTCRITVRLDVTQDADLIAWLEAQPRGTRSDAVRTMLRRSVKCEDPNERVIDYEAFRQMIADELAKALQDVHLYSPSQPHDNATLNDDTEAKYGAKLDQMLGGLGEGE